MWPSVYEIEQLVLDRAQERLREAERRRLIREARLARGSRGLRERVSSALGIRRGPAGVRHLRPSSSDA
jgi:hypothetical protein